MSLIEFENGKPIINLGELDKIKCKCGHSMMCHYFCEGCCDRSMCWCGKFEQAEATNDR